MGDGRPLDVEEGFECGSALECRRRGIPLPKQNEVVLAQAQVPNSLNGRFVCTCINASLDPSTTLRPEPSLVGIAY